MLSCFVDLHWKRSAPYKKHFPWCSFTYAILSIWSFKWVIFRFSLRAQGCFSTVGRWWGGELAEPFLLSCLASGWIKGTMADLHLCYCCLVTIAYFSPYFLTCPALSSPSASCNSREWECTIWNQHGGTLNLTHLVWSSRDSTLRRKNLPREVSGFCMWEVNWILKLFCQSCLEDISRAIPCMWQAVPSVCKPVTDSESRRDGEVQLTSSRVLPKLENTAQRCILKDLPLT